MSLKINDAKNPECLDCGTFYDGQFCPNCGQKRIAGYNSLWELVKQFFDNYLGLDTKLSRTLIPIITKPGFLTNQYRLGKRSSFIHPIRFFVFISLDFFLIVALLPDTNPLDIKINPDQRTEEAAVSESVAMVIDSAAALHADTSKTSEDIVPDTIYLFGDAFPLLESYEAYLDYRDGLDEKPHVIGDAVIKQAYKLTSANPDEVTKEVNRIFMSLLPKLVFLIIPIFALLLKLLYIRRGHFYEEHFIFSVHFHAFAYLALLALYLVQYAIAWIPAIFPIIAVVYLFRAMRRVYNQSFGKTFLKISLLVTTYFMVLVLAFTLSLIYAALTY